MCINVSRPGGNGVAQLISIANEVIVRINPLPVAIFVRPSMYHLCYSVAVDSDGDIIPSGMPIIQIPT